MTTIDEEKDICDRLRSLSGEAGLSMEGSIIRRTSSRFCLGVEHGDYNGTELFGVGTDRFIWMAYKPNGVKRLRLFSGNFTNDGVVDFGLDAIPDPGAMPSSWARFPFGAAYILQRECPANGG